MIKPSPTGAFFFMNEKQLFVVFRLLEKTFYKEGEIIFREGEGPSYIYIIRSGQVKIVSNIDEDPFEIIVVKVGQCFGETSVIGI